MKKKMLAVLFSGIAMVGIVTTTNVQIKANSALSITNGRTWFSFSCSDAQYNI